MFLPLAAIAVLFITLPPAVWAHCDTESGPVAAAARKALESGNFDTIAIWVGEGQEQELRASFGKAFAVYKMGGKAGALAQHYFMETAVRLHREAEGMKYTGLKPAQPLPSDIAMAEKALETGNLAQLTDLLSLEMRKETRKWFQKALYAKKKYKGETVEAGRQWVDAYVKYVIYVHGLYSKIQARPEHGVGHVE
ncbi:MAG: DUF6448 family protein [Candidatus Sulfobium sp.]